jgi:NADH dehydrogenase/NADH:ubiquinone oxidoreductase subunit G
VPEQALGTEAARCLHCDCRARGRCQLRDLATAYGADARTWRDRRPTFEQDLSHHEVIYEPGKCIVCGLCVQVAAAHDEPYGQTFLGRGIAVRVGPPLRKSLAVALAHCAERCVEVCPTGALAFRGV